VDELAGSFRVSQTTVLGHVRRHGIPKRDPRVLRQADIDRAAKQRAIDERVLNSHQRRLDAVSQSA